MRSRDKSLHSSGSHFSQFCPFGSGRFRKLHFSDFYVLIVLHHPAKFEKNSYNKSSDKNLGTFGKQSSHIWAKINNLGKKRIFGEISPNEFYQIIVTCHAAKFGKRICTRYPGNKHAKCCVNIKQKLAIDQSQDFLANVT